MAKEKKLKLEPQVKLDVDLGDEESYTAEEALAKIAMTLAETKNPKILSELDDYEIKLLSALLSASEYIEEKMIQKFVDNFLLLRVSNRRQGRKEILEIAKSSREAQDSRFMKLKQMIGMGR